MEKVVEPPIRYNVKIAEVSCTLFYTFGPVNVTLVYICFIEDDLYLALLVVDIDLEIALYYNNLCKFIPKIRGITRYGLQYDWFWQK